MLRFAFPACIVLASLCCAEDLKVKRIELHDGAPIVATSYFVFDDKGVKSYQVKRLDGTRVVIGADKVKEIVDDVVRVDKAPGHLARPTPAVEPAAPQANAVDQFTKATETNLRQSLATAQQNAQQLRASLTAKTAQHTTAVSAFNTLQAKLANAQDYLANLKREGTSSVQKEEYKSNRADAMATIETCRTNIAQAQSVIDLLVPELQELKAALTKAAAVAADADQDLKDFLATKVQPGAQNPFGK